MPTNTTTHTAGELAFVDSLSGLVPCKVVEVSATDITVRITAARGPYKRGEIIFCRYTRVVPRSCVRSYRSTNHRARIINNYRWVA